MRILAVSGSLRKESSNAALLAAAKSLAPSSVTVELFGSLGELPFFDPDLDGDNPPEPVRALRRALENSDALLISTPEYAHGIPGVLKNALDWLVGDPKFAGKPVGVLFASATDSSFARQALLEVLRTMSARVVPKAVASVAGVRAKVKGDGKIADAAADQLRQVLAALVA